MATTQEFCDQCDQGVHNWRYTCPECGDLLHWRCVAAHRPMCEASDADEEENRLVDDIILSLS
jgi:predicted RNA-binding Zn-ribbon protein involved in translation (DUF1610 family)